MTNLNEYLNLCDLDVYKFSNQLSEKSWNIYKELNWRIKRVLGDQMMRSIDSVSANIAEGYGRYHYLDKIKFYYNARGSLLEASYWIDSMYKRKIILNKEYMILCDLINVTHIKLNSLIKSQYNRKYK